MYYRKILSVSFAVYITLHTAPDFLQNFWGPEEIEHIKKEFDVSPTSTIKLHGIRGDITVKTWSQPRVLIEATKTGTADQLQNFSVTAKKDEHALTIKLEAAGQIKVVPQEKNPASVRPAHVKSDTKTSTPTVAYLLMVPEKSSIIIEVSQQAHVKIQHVAGSLDVSVKKGSIAISDAQSSVTAKTADGDITLKQKKLAKTATIFLESTKGSINLDVPRDLTATLSTHTESGSITSSLPITLYPVTMKLSQTSWDQLKKTVKGTLNGEGAPITLQTNRGNIVIGEY